MGRMQVCPGRMWAGTQRRPALFLEASNRQCWGELCKPPLGWPYGTGTSSLLGHSVAYIKHA